MPSGEVLHVRVRNDAIDIEVDMPSLGRVSKKESDYSDDESIVQIVLDAAEVAQRLSAVAIAKKRAELESE